MRPGEWFTEDIQYLIEHYPNMKTADIAASLNRSVGSISTKAYKLGIKKTPEIISKTMRERYDADLTELNFLAIEDVPLDIAFKHREWLKVHYNEKELSLYDIAEITNSTRKNIEYWMKKFDLPRRNDQDRFTERCLQKISDTGKGRVPFSKGLTKHDHPSLMKISEKLSGENNYWWKGGVCNNKAGYRMLKDDDHPKSDKYGYVLEHRLVMEFMQGRLLEDREVVHHRDCNRKNNVTSNLFLFPSNSAHTSFHNYKKWHDAGITEERFMKEVYKNAN